MEANSKQALSLLVQHLTPSPLAAVEQPTPPQVVMVVHLLYRL